MSIIYNDKISEKVFLDFPIKINSINMDLLLLKNNFWYYNNINIMDLNTENIPFFTINIDDFNIKFYFYNNEDNSRKKIYNGVFYDFLYEGEDEIKKMNLVAKIKLLGLGKCENSEDEINKFKKIIHYVNDTNLRNLQEIY